MTRWIICPSVSAVSISVSLPALKQRAIAFGDFQVLAEHERVKFSYDDLGSLDRIEQVLLPRPPALE
jgi:hypothetical protein